MRLYFLLFLLLCSNRVFTQKVSTFIDERDGKTYATVQIGSQTWLSENLNTEKFQNGDIIPESKSQDEWMLATNNEQPTWCYYDFNSENGKIYGKIYNRYAVFDRRGLSPKGWHIPSMSDWKTLELGVQNSCTHSSTVVECLKSNTLWINGENGTNESGFNALPGGFHESDEFLELGQITHFWGSKGIDDNIWLRTYNQSLASEIPTGSSHDGFEGDGFYVRCLQDLKQSNKSKKLKNKSRKQ